MHAATMPHACQIHMCMLLLCHMHVKYTCACCYYATCMSNTHVHAATMPHACQIHMCMLLLCHMHVKYTCAYCYYATCISNTYVHVAIVPCAVNLPTIRRYVIDPYQISFTLMLFIPTQTQCMYHRASYISTVLDSLLITFHKGNSICLSCVCSHFLTHSSSTATAEYQHLPGRHAAHVPHLPGRHAAHVPHLPCRHAAHVPHLPCRHAAHVPHLPGRHAEIYHSACVPHTQKLKRATGTQHASRRMHNS